MKLLNYEDIKNKIVKYYSEKLKIERKIEDEDKQKQILTTIFGRIDQDFEIKDFYVMELIGDESILKYTGIDNEKNKEIENIILIKNSKPIFKLEHYEKKKKDTTYCENAYSIYEENSYYLMNKIHTTTITNQNFTNLTTIILNRTNHNIRDYYRKKYTFYLNNNNVIALRTNNSMYIETEVSFENILPTALKLINNSSTKIVNHLENITTEDNVKEYHVRRKIKK